MNFKYDNTLWLFNPEYNYFPFKEDMKNNDKFYSVFKTNDNSIENFHENNVDRKDNETIYIYEKKEDQFLKNDNEQIIYDCNNQSFYHNFINSSDPLKLNTNYLFNEDEIQIEKKKKRGRRKKDEDTRDCIHRSTDVDNVFYKLKVHAMKSIYDILNKSYQINHKGKFNKIAGDIIKDGKKDSNLEFFNSPIEKILLKRKSKRHDNSNNLENDEIIKYTKEDKIGKRILEMKFDDYVKNIFMKYNKEDFIKEFRVESKSLYSVIDLPSEQKKTMKELVEFGIINHFNKINGRVRNKNKN